MKKKVFSFLLVLTLLLQLFACANKQVADTSANNQAVEVISQEEVVTVSDELKSLYASKALNFTSVKNARDIGGYVNKDGKKVKNNIFVRCGHLAKLSDEEEKILKEKYNVKEIVDFRTNAEIGHSVDKKIDGMNYQKIDIIEEVTGDDPVVTNMKPVTGDNSADMMVSYYQNRGTIDDMYDEIVNGIVAHEGYRKFFDILLNNDGGIIFHCSSGKDRTGFAAVYILSILGVDRKTILDDYEASNVFYEKNMKNVVKPLEEAGFTFDDIKEITRLVGIDRKAMEKALDVIDKEYGGMDSYLHNQIGLTDAEMDTLRGKYLE